MLCSSHSETVFYVYYYLYRLSLHPTLAHIIYSIFFLDIISTITSPISSKALLIETLAYIFYIHISVPLFFVRYVWYSSFPLNDHHKILLVFQIRVFTFIFIPDVICPKWNLYRWGADIIHILLLYLYLSLFWFSFKS